LPDLSEQRRIAGQLEHADRLRRTHRYALELSDTFLPAAFLRALETFEALGVHFVSLTESVDTSTPVGKMVFTILGSVAEMERQMIVERVRAGLRNARAKGKTLGRPQGATWC
jgi:DNA invertase Pin-like site-specific DNA recombinase